MSLDKYFDKVYYHNCCGELPYDHPAWLSFFSQIADRIIEDFHPQTVLDVGCAMGHLVSALRDRNVAAFGIDVSKYAISKVRPEHEAYCRVCSALETLPADFPHHFDVLVTIEVAEHLHEEECSAFFENICQYADTILFSSTPSDYEEETHFNVQQPEYWMKRFAARGFFRDVLYDATYISRQAVALCREQADYARVVEAYEHHGRLLANRLEKQVLRTEELTAQLAKKDELAVAFRAEFDAQLAKNEAIVSELRQANEASESQLTQHSDEMLAFHAMLEDAEQREQSARDRAVSLGAQIAYLHSTIEEMADKRAQLTRYHHDLQSQIRERDETLASIYRSRCYRCAQVYYRIREAIIPHGSRRFVLAKAFFHIPQYIKQGYLQKAASYVFHHGFRGIKSKVLGAVLGGVPGDNGQKCTYDLVTRHPIDGVIPHTDSVDIIICVHNAYEDVKRCIESVFVCTSEPYGLILVDDGSDEETRTYLEKIETSCQQVRRIRNERGNGYTIAANIGLRSSTADYCVLLNSDTVVTNGWLDKMIACSKSNPEIGIVGPLSNTASWQSVPQLFDSDGDWCHNPLPEGYSIRDYGKMIEKYVSHYYFGVPLLNGFCLLITRETINRIGFFDEELFGRGFGEEDDYNLRARAAGIKLAVADDVYIFHAQSRSYSDERRKQLCLESGQRLRSKHGDALLDTSVNQIHRSFILEGIRSRTSAMIIREELCRTARQMWEGKTIMFILPLVEAGGGGNVIIQEASVMRRMGVNVWLYNLLEHRESFECAYPELDIPVLYGNELHDFTIYAPYFDVICNSLYSSVSMCSFPFLQHPPRLAYYIQDYEPFFFLEGSAEYQKAFESYTAIEGMTLVTKTAWNAEKVARYHHVRCTILGPSVNVDLFRPQKNGEQGGQVHICAMVRPSSSRRAPELTMEVLLEVSKRFGCQVSISIFGSDPLQSASDKAFFDQVDTGFPYRQMGKLSPEQMAQFLGENDIFADFSSFQAMGLTAMEAMACGCATIVPQNGGTGSFAVHESNCLMVDTSCKQVCVDALCRLISDHALREKIRYRAIGDMCAYPPEKCAYRFLEAVFGSEGDERCE